MRVAALWAGEEVASRVRFTDIAHKDVHIRRCRVADLFLDTFQVHLSFNYYSMTNILPSAMHIR
jgi:hypothetical protein